eukprot:SAG31_NODE_4067_length_3622_cov_17.161510_3_plen_133_part_00
MATDTDTSAFFSCAHGDAASTSVQNIDLSPAQVDAIADLPLMAGQASFHHGWVVHGSHPNMSDRRRCGITCIYAPAGLVPYVGDPDAEKSMRSSTSATAATGAVPWSEGFLVSGTGASSHIKALPEPQFPKL